MILYNLTNIIHITLLSKVSYIELSTLPNKNYRKPDEETRF